MIGVLAAAALAAGMTIEADMKGGEIHSYDVDLAAGTFVAIRIDQRGIDVRAAFVGPDGSTVIEMDTGEWGDELAAFVAPAGGRYRAEARAADAKAPAGHYILHVDALRAATSDDEATAAATVLHSQAYATLRKGGRDNMLRARDQYRAALEAWKTIGNRRGEADACTALGYTLNWLDDFPGAAEYYARDLALRREIGDDYGEARALVGHGGNVGVMGEAATAVAEWEIALARHKEAGRLNSAVDVLRRLASEARIAGDYGRALEYGYEAVNTSRQIGSAMREANALTAIGAIHLGLDEFELAIDDYRRARQLLPDDDVMAGLTDAQEGAALVRLARYEEAEAALNRAMKVWTANGQRGYASNTLRYLGELSMGRGDYQRAREAFEEAADKAREARFLLGEAIATREAGEALLRLGHLEDADRVLAAAAVLFTRIDPLGESTVWIDQSRLALARADFATARRLADAAIGVVESVRGRAGSGRLRSAMFASVQSYYSALIDVLMTQHRADPAAGLDRMAFDVAERARARSLLDLLLDDRLDTSGAADGAIAAMRDLHRRIDAKAQALEDARSARRSDLAAKLARDLAELNDAYGLAEGRARRERHQDGVAEPQRLEDIQRQVLDPSTVLIEFSVGETASYAWLVTQSSITSVTLAPRRDLDRMATAAQQALRTRSSDGQALAAASRALIAPLGPLPRGSRLLIVAPGSLQQVPFAALPVGPRRQPLIAFHDVVHAPSASVVGAIRTAFRSRPRAPRTLAAFADPVFDEHDPRVRTSNGTPSQAAATPGLPSSNVRAGLSRLPFTRMEADAIASLVPSASRMLATDFDANLRAISNPGLASYRIVHIATHGIVDTRTPELSGLALSMVDSAGHRQDGFLRLHDVDRLHLNADLVVLSGCDTALGQTVEGEGVIGLTRGFVAAGAASVVASLWKVDDLATAELMKAFYQDMLVAKHAPVEALRTAQRHLAASSRWRDPYFWAGFVIQGEWR